MLFSASAFAENKCNFQADKITLCCLSSSQSDFEICAQPLEGDGGLLLTRPGLNLGGNEFAGFKPSAKNSETICNTFNKTNVISVSKKKAPVGTYVSRSGNEIISGFDVFAQYIYQVKCK